MGVTVGGTASVAVITLDWPERRNALDLAGMAEVAAAIRQAGASGAAVVVLTGNGAFCAGADLRSVAARSGAPAEERRAGMVGVVHDLIRAVVDCPVPVFAAIDGPAVGLGFDLALACDDRLIGPDGWCQQGWGRLGLIPGAGGELMLRLRHPSLLWTLLADQPRIDGPAAQRWRLARAVTTGTALDAAIDQASRLARIPRRALEAYVSLHRATLRRELPDHLAECARVQPALLGDAALPGRVAQVLDGSAAAGGKG